MLIVTCCGVKVTLSRPHFLSVSLSHLRTHMCARGTDMYSSMHAFKLCTRKSIAVSHTTRSYISTLRLHKTLVCWWNTEFDFWYKRHLLHIALVYDISDTGTRLRVLSFRENIYKLAGIYNRQKNWLPWIYKDLKRNFPKRVRTICAEVFAALSSYHTELPKTNACRLVYHVAPYSHLWKHEQNKQEVRRVLSAHRHRVI